MEKEIIFQGDWLIGKNVLAVPDGRAPIVKYEELKKTVRKTAHNGKKSLGGWVGFLSYELGKKFLGLKQKAEKNPSCPEVYFVYCPTLNGLCEPRNGLKSVRAHSEASLVHVHKPWDKNEKRQRSVRTDSNLTYPQYEKKLQAIKNYLFDGDTYQVNFSQRFSTPWEGDPYELFQKISKLNPSPYQFFCEGELPAGKNFAVISNSPELLVRGMKTTDGVLIQTRPIKGTVPRGKNPQEDAKNIRQLLNSKKDEAELAMIVDLERNDLGRVCIPNTIHVRDHRAIEEYSHVIHTSSTVEGMLDPRRDVFDVIESIFPGGSITGCPKKRTMEIIDELEDFPRGVYCGSAGYILDDGTFEFNIMIRTMLYRRGRLIFHSGGGIVADSDPKQEYRETLSKAAALQKALTEVGTF